MDIKTSKFLGLAPNLKSLSEKLVGTIESKNDFSFQEKIIFGLGKKMFLAFNALISDAEKGRLEAMHHLKTLIECYIYFRWIGNDLIKAKLIYARLCKEKIDFFDANPNYGIEPEIYNHLKSIFDETIKGIEQDWKNFKPNNRYKSIARMAEDCGLKDYYNRIYKIACEPAHITDLGEYMPTSDTTQLLEKTKLANYWAFVALDYSIFSMCNLLENVCDFYSLADLKKDVILLKEQHDEIRS